MVQIQNSTLQFLSELKCNNNRDWFIQNRKRYEAAKKNYETFVQAAIEAITTFDPILKGLEARNCMYRINRDIRFSPDKTLYKTHLGAFVVRGGRKNGDRFAGYYIHIEPAGNSMIAGGAYLPPMPWLTAIRRKIDEEGERFLKIINDKQFKKIFGELEGERLKTAPKGFPKDHRHIELLKMKSYLVSRMIPDKEVVSGDYLDSIVTASKAMKPLNDFFNEYLL
jgi:uncharacterized protein (TIGR02453 family)